MDLTCISPLIASSAGVAVASTRMLNLFKSEYSSTCYKACCNEKTIRCDPFMVVTLNFISENDTIPVSLSECITHFSNVEEVHDYYCERCSIKGNMKKTLRIDVTSDMLIFHLKRFKTDSATHLITKLSTAVSFPLEGFQLTPGSPVYDCMAVANHLGEMNGKGGHYTTHARRGDPSRWFCFNDSEASVLSPVDSSLIGTLNKNAYLLFYVRRY